MAASDDEGRAGGAAATVVIPDPATTPWVPGAAAAPKAFAKPDPRSRAGRRRADSAMPLDFSRNKTIGRFELIREIARGGMGQVFLGRDTKLGRKVAIKFLLRDDAHFVQRFLVEARATALCTHENIVTIYEVGEHERLPYMVLEYLDGKTLFELLETKPSQRQFVELMISVVRALVRAHEHGIVHRDLKPSNIFVTDRGQVKVLDFGVAQLTDVEMPEGVVDDNSIVGTLPYMSPEQWGTGTVDQLSDLWAIGILFWRALVGVHPAGKAPPDKLRERVLDLATPFPSIAMHPTVPAELAAIVDKCLAKHKPDRYQSASELLHDLEAFLQPRADVATGEGSPYRGLAAFGEEDAKYFFGRANEIRTALSHLESWPLLAVIGPSGVGKSSFVHAGLVPAVRAEGGTWQVCVVRPGRSPLQRLASALEEMLATGERADGLAERLQQAPGLFGVMLREAAARRNTNMLVVVDQLEELFTLCESDAVRELFLAALLAAADDAMSPVRVVLSMRADFLDRLANHKHFLAEVSRALLFLTAPDRDNLRETVERPAQLAGYAFEGPQIVDDMLQVATSRGALPLLSFAASRLWDVRDRKRKLLTLAGYHQMGGVGGAFARHADQIAGGVPAQSQMLLRAIMTRLVTPEGTRAVVDHAELLSLAKDRDEVERILDQLVRGRLIHLHTETDQGVTVEIVHEMLITEWPTLKRWLEESHAMRAFTHELRQAARQWHARNRASDLVWRGATAQEALGHAKRYVLDLSAVENDFLAAIRTQVARSRRRKVFAFTATLVVLGLGLGGALFAYMRIDEENQQTLEAKSQLQGKVDALEAEKRARETEKRARESAEQDKRREAEKRAQVEQDLATTQQMSREQLEDANRALKLQVDEAKVATRKAELEQQRATKSSNEAETAKRELQRKYDDERKAREAAEAALRKSGIAVDLSTPTKGKTP